MNLKISNIINFNKLYLGLLAFSICLWNLTCAIIFLKIKEIDTISKYYADQTSLKFYELLEKSNESYSSFSPVIPPKSSEIYLYFIKIINKDSNLFLTIAMLNILVLMAGIIFSSSSLRLLIKINLIPKLTLLNKITINCSLSWLSLIIVFISAKQFYKNIDSNLYASIIFIFSFVCYRYIFILINDQSTYGFPKKRFWKGLQISIIFISFIIISLMGLLLLGIMDFISPSRVSIFYPDITHKNFLILLYSCGFAVITFSIQMCILYLRNNAVKQTEKIRWDTQLNTLKESIEKRFQKGVTLLGNENESVRLGGIYILWDIIKNAAQYVTIDQHTNNSSTTQREIYKKSYSLHIQILNILCAHIRTKSNSKEYLLEYYPSILKVKYPKIYAEYYGTTLPSISSKDEKPSNEIQTLLNLLTQSKIHISDIPTYVLGFILNFENAILKGMDCTYSYFCNANCKYTNFEYSDLSDSNFIGSILSFTNFEYASCLRTNFSQSNLIGTNFEGSHCDYAILNQSVIDGVKFNKHSSFIHSQFQSTLSNIQFNEVILTHSNFSGALFKSKVSFKNADCRYANFQHASMDNVTFENSDCSHANFNATRCQGVKFSGLPQMLKGTTFFSLNTTLGEISALNIEEDTTSITFFINSKLIRLTENTCEELSQLLECPSLSLKALRKD